MMKTNLLYHLYKPLSAISPFHIGVAAIVIILSWYTIFGNQGLYRLYELKLENRRMKEEILNLKDEIKAREKQMALFSDPTYLETIVRQELGYVKPGEIIFQLSP